MCTVCIRYSVPCRRGLSVGYGVHVWWVGGLVVLGVRCAGVLWRVWVRCYGVCMACYGVCGYGVRVVYVWCTLCMCRVVYVVCTLCISFYDVVCLRRIRPNKTKHLKQSINDIKRMTTNTKRMNSYSIVFN